MSGAQEEIEQQVQLMGNPTLELAVRMPWIHAKGDTWWLISGTRNNGTTFTDCIARVVPRGITGSEVPVFEMLIYTDPVCIRAAEITSARELFFVYADNPRRALNPDDQRDVDDAHVGPIA